MSDSDVPIVSVITPLYNKVAYLQECVQSVLNQDFTNWEMLIVDDHSTDGSVELLHSLAVKEPRITPLFNAKNEGAAFTRNRAIQAARGRYIAFLDADDRWLPGKLSAQLRFMKSKNAVLSCTDYIVMNGSGALSGRKISAPDEVSYRHLLKSNSIGCLTAMYDTHLAGVVLMPEIRMRQDYALWLKILRNGGKAYCLHQVLAEYRQYSSSLSSNKLATARYNWKVLREFEGLPLLTALWYFGWYVGISLFKYYGR